MTGSSPPSQALRLVRLLRPARNPLARGTDRFESAVVILFLLLAVLLVPVMLTVGSLTYASLAEQSAQQSRSRHETVAVLTEDAPAATVGTHGEVSGKAKVAARWQSRDGIVHTGLVEAEDGSKAGTEVSVWLDASGRPVNPPISTMDSVATGVLAAVFGWFSIVGLFGLVFWGLRHMVDRHRYRAWDAAWVRLEADWHDRSR